MSNSTIDYLVRISTIILIPINAFLYVMHLIPLLDKITKEKQEDFCYVNTLHEQIHLHMSPELLFPDASNAHDLFLI